MLAKIEVKPSCGAFLIINTPTATIITPTTNSTATIFLIQKIVYRFFIFLQLKKQKFVDFCFLAFVFALKLYI